MQSRNIAETLDKSDVSQFHHEITMSGGEICLFGDFGRFYNGSL